MKRTALITMVGHGTKVVSDHQAPRMGQGRRAMAVTLRIVMLALAAAGCYVNRPSLWPRSFSRGWPAS